MLCFIAVQKHICLKQIKLFRLENLPTVPTWKQLFRRSGVSEGINGTMSPQMAACSSLAQELQAAPGSTE